MINTGIIEAKSIEKEEITMTMTKIIIRTGIMKIIIIIIIIIIIMVIE